MSDHHPYDAVFFDFDGVIVDSVDIKTRAFRTLYEDHGPDVVEAVVAHHLRHGGISRRQKIRHYHSTLLGQELDREELERLVRRFSGLVEDAVVAADWVAGARALLDRAYGRLALFVVSGTPEDELQRVVARRGIAHLFSEVRGSPPEKVEVVKELLGKHRLDPGRVLFVGDAITDHDAAAAHRLPFVGRVPPGAPSPFPDGATTVSDLTQLVV